MNAYSILVFLHVLGGVGIFIALAIEAIALGRLRSAETLEGARTWTGLLAIPKRLGFPAMLATLVPGAWMMVVNWGPQPWIQAALLGFVAMVLVAVIVSGRGMRRLAEGLRAEAGPGLSAAFRALGTSPALRASLRFRLAVATGILALMTAKPALSGSLLIMGAAVLVGLVPAAPFGRRRSAGARLDEATRARPELEGART